MSRLFVPGSNSSASALDGGGGSASGISNSRPSGKMPAARETANWPLGQHLLVDVSSREAPGAELQRLQAEFSVSSMNGPAPANAEE